MKKLYLSCILLLTPQCAHAIVNVDQAVIGPQQDGISQQLSMSADAARGNTVKSSIKGESLTQWKHQKHTEFLMMQAAYGTSRQKVDRNQSFAHLRHRSQFNQRWAIEAFAQVGRNPFSRLSKRSLLGGGMRFTAFEVAKQSAIYIGVGGFYEKEVLSQQAGTNDRFSNKVRANTYLILRHRFNEQLRVDNTSYYQPDTHHPQDYRLLEKISLNIQLMEHMDLKVSLDFSYDSRPPQTVKPNDLSYQTGLQLQF